MLARSRPQPPRPHAGRSAGSHSPGPPCPRSVRGGWRRRVLGFKHPRPHLNQHPPWLDCLTARHPITESSVAHPALRVFPLNGCATEDRLSDAGSGILPISFGPGRSAPVTPACRPSCPVPGSPRPKPRRPCRGLGASPPTPETTNRAAPAPVHASAKVGRGGPCRPIGVQT